MSNSELKEAYGKINTTFGLLNPFPSEYNKTLEKEYDRRTFSKAEEYRGFHDRYRNNSEFILSCITPPTSKVLANQFLPEEDRFELDPLVGLGISRSFIDSSFHRLNNTSSASALDRKVRSNEPASSSSNVFFRDGDVDAKRPVYARAKHDAGRVLDVNNTNFKKTDTVTIEKAGNATRQGKLYEEGVVKLYENNQQIDTSYTTEIEGKPATGIADGAVKLPMGNGSRVSRTAESLQLNPPQNRTCGTTASGSR